MKTPAFILRSWTFDVRRSTLPRPSSAFSLVEVVIALGIAAFCLVAMLGLIPSGLKSAKNTTDQTAAAILLDDLALDLRNTQAGSNITPLYAITLPAAGTAAANATTNFFINEDTTKTNTNSGLSTRYGVLLTMSNPTAYTTTAWIQVYWPPTIPVSSLSSALGLEESFVTIRRQ
jgi:uncharacterized protein (TIGR02598 family)